MAGQGQRLRPADLVILDIGLPDISGFENHQIRRAQALLLDSRAAEGHPFGAMAIGLQGIDQRVGNCAVSPRSR